MTEFESQLVEQLKILNENLSTKNLPGTKVPAPNFAAQLIVNQMNISERIKILTNTLDLLIREIHSLKKESH